MKQLLILMLLLFSLNSFGESLTGNDIISHCPLLLDTDKLNAPADMYNAAHCAGYLNGLNEMAVLFQTLFEIKIYCLPEKGIETGQLIRVAQKWLEEHPAELHESARSLFISIMKDNFPCK